jgi:hypothetical protein
MLIVWLHEEEVQEDLEVDLQEDPEVELQEDLEVDPQEDLQDGVQAVKLLDEHK